MKTIITKNENLNEKLFINSVYDEIEFKDCNISKIENLKDLVFYSYKSLKFNNVENIGLLFEIISLSIMCLNIEFYNCFVDMKTIKKIPKNINIETFILNNSAMCFSVHKFDHFNYNKLHLINYELTEKYYLANLENINLPNSSGYNTKYPDYNIKINKSDYFSSIGLEFLLSCNLNLIKNYRVVFENGDYCNEENLKRLIKNKKRKEVAKELSKC